MDNTLFRKEVYRAQEQRWGATRIDQPISIRIFVWAGGLLCIVFLVFLFCATYTSKAKVQGFLEPTSGLITLWSPQAGLLKEVYVKEGQAVKKGEPLFVISADQASLASLDSQAKVLSQIIDRKNNLQKSLQNENQIEILELEALTASHKKLLLDVEQTEHEIQIATQKVASLQSIVDRYQILQKNQYVSGLETEQASQRLLEASAQLQALYKRRITLHDDINQIGHQKELRSSRSENERNTLQRQIVAVDQEITLQQQKQASVIVAPADGVVASLQIHQNQMVASNQRLTALMPQGVTLKATLLVPSKSAGFLKSHQTVLLRYSAFPYQKFGSGTGRVSVIDQSLTIPGETPLPIPLKEPAYLVTVELDKQVIDAFGKAYNLKAGMALEADIRLETRSMIEWLLEPILGFTQKV